MKDFIITCYRLAFKEQVIIVVCISRKDQTRRLLAEIFVDDTLFTRNDDLCKAFSEEMSKEIEMFMFSEIKFFVGL